MAAEAEVQARAARHRRRSKPPPPLTISYADATEMGAEEDVKLDFLMRNPLAALSGSGSGGEEESGGSGIVMARLHPAHAHAQLQTARLHHTVQVSQLQAQVQAERAERARVQMELAYTKEKADLSTTFAAHAGQLVASGAAAAAAAAAAASTSRHHHHHAHHPSTPPLTSPYDSVVSADAEPALQQLRTPPASPQQLLNERAVWGEGSTRPPPLQPQPQLQQAALSLTAAAPELRVSRRDREPQQSAAPPLPLLRHPVPAVLAPHRTPAATPQLLFAAAPVAGAGAEIAKSPIAAPTPRQSQGGEMGGALGNSGGRSGRSLLLPHQPQGVLREGGGEASAFSPLRTRQM